MQIMGSSHLHVALLSSPGMGHLIPVLVLADHLATHHHLKVTVLAITTAAETQFLKSHVKSSNPTVDIVPVPAADVSGLIDEKTQVFTQLRITVREALPHVRSTIAGLAHRPDALIVDIFCTQALGIAKELGIPRYAYHPTTAWTATLAMYFQVFDETITGQFVDRLEPLRIPGCMPVQPEDMVDPLMDRNDQQYREYVNLGIEYTQFDGLLINTWEELEPNTVKALRENEELRAIVKVPVYPIGPLKRSVESKEGEGRDEILKWLDRQPVESVLYVSFGSGGLLTAEQTAELAWGLENSRQRFVWVVRPPCDGGPDGSINPKLEGGGDAAADYLPEGFLARTKDVGFVVQMWANQIEILTHPSVGGFMSHCGWNSTLESLTNNVPIIAWPLYAEQKMNAAMLAEEVGVAVRPAVTPTEKVVRRQEIEGMVRTLLQYKEGEAIRERVKKLKVSGEIALSKAGSSYNSMCELVKDMEARMLTKSREIYQRK
ncbi:PREDICTED: anthocyanidin 3-O-glucosyltransferase 5-like [Ipomoea nil]|uniref:anthocyanidin 3-O-glucosyltransferase 5-like n=1 Tax=Ipomoea nil TaxID=35883 RepID=UPI000900FB33|nr:PREDICTED: anthocyanidin 3-O-glucosyltransferase 5-like [Ipomoea nil]